MKYDAKLMVVRDLFPSEVLIDRLPLEDEFGRLRRPPHLQGSGMPLHASDLAELFAFRLVPEGDGELNLDNMADILLDRLKDGPGPLHRLMEIYIPSRKKPEGDL